MTALNFALQQDAISIAMDTLASCDEDKRPLLFSSKIFLVPHLNGVICGTGLLQFVMEWFLFVNSHFVVKNMVHLDQYAPTELRKIYANTIDDAEVPSLKSTIYHFGYDSKLKGFVGFAYRSKDDFKSEILKLDHAAFKPPPSTLANGENLDLDILPNAFIRIMEMQKKEDENKPIREKVGIGGDIHFLHISKNPDTVDGLPILYQIQHCHRFMDYDEMYELMVKNLDNQMKSTLNG